MFHTQQPAFHSSPPFNLSIHLCQFAFVKRSSQMTPKMSRIFRTLKIIPLTDFTTSLKDVEEFKQLFKHFLWALYHSVDAHSWIKKIRDTSDSGVEKRICLFHKTSVQPKAVFSKGMVLDYGNLVAVNLDDAHHSHVYYYFTGEVLIGDKLKAAGYNWKKCYGIIDCVHLNAAVLWMVVNKASRKNYSWFVTVIEGRNSVDRYRQLDIF